MGRDAVPTITVNPILKDESRWVRQLQYTYRWWWLGETRLRPSSGKKELDALYIWCQVMNCSRPRINETWVWVRLASDLNIESPQNKMTPRHCQSRTPCRLWRWSEQYLNIQDNGTWWCERGYHRVSLIKQYLPTINRGVNSGANNSLQACPFKGFRVYSVLDWDNHTIPRRLNWRRSLRVLCVLQALLEDILNFFCSFLNSSV